MKIYKGLFVNELNQPLSGWFTYSKKAAMNHAAVLTVQHSVSTVVVEAELDNLSMWFDFEQIDELSIKTEDVMPSVNFRVVS